MESVAKLLAFLTFRFVQLALFDRRPPFFFLKKDVPTKRKRSTFCELHKKVLNDS